MIPSVNQNEKESGRDWRRESESGPDWRRESVSGRDWRRGMKSYFNGTKTIQCINKRQT